MPSSTSPTGSKVERALAADRQRVTAEVAGAEVHRAAGHVKVAVGRGRRAFGPVQADQRVVAAVAAHPGLARRFRRHHRVDAHRRRPGVGRLHLGIPVAVHVLLPHAAVDQRHGDHAVRGGVHPPVDHDLPGGVDLPQVAVCVVELVVGRAIAAMDHLAVAGGLRHRHWVAGPGRVVRPRRRSRTLAEPKIVGGLLPDQAVEDAERVDLRRGGIDLAVDGDLAVAVDCVDDALGVGDAGAGTCLVGAVRAGGGHRHNLRVNIPDTPARLIVPMKQH